MNLDDLSRFKELDPQGMLAHIDGLPDQLQSAWDSSQKQALEFADGTSPSASDIRQVVISGMGGSAIGADLVAAAVMDTCPVPIFCPMRPATNIRALRPGLLVLAIC